MTETELTNSNSSKTVEVEHDPLEELNLDIESKNMVQEPRLEPPKDLSGAQMDIIQIITRQTYGKLLATVADDFYQVISELQHKGVANENLVTNRLGRFIDVRIERILQYSYGFQGNIMESLSIEEQDLYSKIQEAVADFRNEINKKINSS